MILTILFGVFGRHFSGHRRPLPRSPLATGLAASRGERPARTAASMTTSGPPLLLHLGGAGHLCNSASCPKCEVVTTARIGVDETSDDPSEFRQCAAIAGRLGRWRRRLWPLYEQLAQPGRPGRYAGRRIIPKAKAGAWPPNRIAAISTNIDTCRCCCADRDGAAKEHADRPI